VTANSGFLALVNEALAIVGLEIVGLEIVDQVSAVLAGQAEVRDQVARADLVTVRLRREVRLVVRRAGRAWVRRRIGGGWRKTTRKCMP
jgi:hypothetical protein